MEPQYPLLIDRIQSMFIDVVLIIIIMFGFSSVLDKFDDAPNWVRIGLCIGVWAIYEPLAVTFGCTLGQYLKKIRVKSIRDEQRRINFLQAFVRYLVKMGLGWVSFLTIHMNAEKRAIHDLVSGSVMIKKRSKKIKAPLEGLFILLLN